MQNNRIAHMGNGNTITERSLRWSKTNTVYKMWNGKALTGPGREQNPPATVERYPALWGTLAFGDFISRYRDLAGLDCKYFAGEELLGQGCTEACAHAISVCNKVTSATCDQYCATAPRAQVDCLGNMTDCSGLQSCGLQGKGTP
jgi:hypothetical protein